MTPSFGLQFDGHFAFDEAVKCPIADSQGDNRRFAIALESFYPSRSTKLRSTHSLPLLAFALGILLAAKAHPQAANSAPAGLQTDTPHLDFVFEEFVTLGASVHPGETPYGERNLVPITGGTFVGPNIRGKVLSGGWDWQLATKTGCHFIQADYMIQADDGTIVNVTNKGTSCVNPGEKRRFITTPTFEAPLGPHAWLNGGAFLGTLEPMTFQGQPAPCTFAFTKPSEVGLTQRQSRFLARKDRRDPGNFSEECNAIRKRTCFGPLSNLWNPTPPSDPLMRATAQP